MRLLLLLLLASCATASPYWVKTHDPRPITSIRYVELPCGRTGIDGCFNRSTGAVELRLGMTEGQDWCARGHEKKHADGYSHPGHREGSFAADCGNGEML